MNLFAKSYNKVRCFIIVILYGNIFLQLFNNIGNISSAQLAAYMSASEFIPTMNGPIEFDANGYRLGYDDIVNLLWKY